jgi:two-component system response regulator QseB
MILTARGNLADRISGLDSGADDYLAKPFEVEELVARVRAILRRPGVRNASVLHVGAISLNIENRDVSIAGSRIELTRRETDFLEILMRHPGAPVLRQKIEEAMYAFNDSVTPNAIEAAASRVRKKLDAAGCQGMLKTHRGFGYVLQDR